MLARHAAAGARTAVVTATWAADTPRAAELAEALRILGAGTPRMLGYADARVPNSVPGGVRFCDAPLDEAVQRLVAHIREFRPDIMVTHDAYGGLPGHPDHVHTHRVTMLAAQAAGLGQLYPDTGAPGSRVPSTWPRIRTRPCLRDVIGARKAVYSVPDEQVTATVDVGPWMKQKIAAVLAHRSEVERGALPGVIASLPSDARERLFATEWYIRHAPITAAAAQTELTA
ncbi:PIG-L deacetylase family protein [Streptomyces sp. S1D4-11]